MKKWTALAMIAVIILVAVTVPSPVMAQDPDLSDVQIVCKAISLGIPFGYLLCYSGYISLVNVWRSIFPPPEPEPQPPPNTVKYIDQGDGFRILACGQPLCNGAIRFDAINAGNCTSLEDISVYYDTEGISFPRYRGWLQESIKGWRLTGSYLEVEINRSLQIDGLAWANPLLYTAHVWCDNRDTATISEQSESPLPTPAPEPPGHDKQLICHCSGNGNNCKTMQVPPPAVDGHLGHGDSLGACP